MAGAALPYLDSESGSDEAPPDAAEDRAFNVSVLVMTFNEEVNIARCLSSIRWSNDVVVIDSGSTDATTAIAATFPNVRLFHRPFTNFADQRNYGIHQIAYRNEWLLILDADEEIDPALQDELARLRPDTGDASVYLVRRSVVLEDQVLRWNLTSAFWIERLFRPKHVRYVGAVHEKLLFEGAPGRLNGRIRHYQFHKGIDDWLERRARYAEMESTARSETLAGNSGVMGGVIARRNMVKRLFYRLPARWAVYYMVSLLFSLAFLDGRKGLKYVGLEAYSQYLATRNRKHAR